MEDVRGATRWEHTSETHTCLYHTNYGFTSLLIIFIEHHSASGSAYWELTDNINTDDMAATSLVHPLDLLKVRLQLYKTPKTTVQMARKIIKCEGCRAMYRGLTAGLMRQATYTTTRLAVYYWLFDEYRKKYGKQPNLNDKIMIGMYAGVAGALAGNPAEVALVRLMAGGACEQCGRCRPGTPYRGTLDAIYKIIHQESVWTLWRGGMLTLCRSMFVSVAQIGTYTLAHSTLVDRKAAKGLELQLYTSMISSFLTALVSLPVDFVKTIYQVRSDSVTQTQIISHVLKNNGVMYLWKGFGPYYIRMTIHTFVTLLLLEEMYEMYWKYENQDKNNKKK